MNTKYTNEIIELIKNYVVERVERDGKQGKDLTLGYILQILEEAKQ